MLPSPSAGIPTPSTAAGTKRPAASDLQRTAGAQATPSKRHATTKASAVAVPPPAAGATPAAAAAALGTPTASVMPPSSASSASFGAPQPMPPMPPMPVLLTEDQLLGRSSEQLIATILQVQAQHQQYFVTISAQYENITQQLNELKGSLAAFYSGQASQYQSAVSQLQTSPQAFPEPRPSRPVAAVAPMMPLGPPRPPPAAHPNPRPVRPPPPPQSPQTSQVDTRLLTNQAGLQPPQTPGPPSYDYRTVGTVDEVWKEYKEGINDQPAIEELDATWGSRWRPEPRGRTWYSRRKVIWDKIKEFIAEGMDEDEAVKEVEKLRDGGTINKLIRMLQDERKDKGVTDDSLGA